MHKNFKKNNGFFKTLKQNSFKGSKDDNDDDDNIDEKTEVGF